MMAIGLSQYNVCLMHTVNHAFFKALLFLGAGAVIHSFADQQDVRKMGGLIKFLPFTYSVMLTGSLSLLATPYLTGFYSKDLILELAFGQYNFIGFYAYILGSITAGITAFYSFRLISLVFLSTPNGNKQSYINSCLPTSYYFFNKFNSKKGVFCLAASAKGSTRSKGEKLEKLNLIVIFPLLLLALLSIFFGFVFSDLFVGIGSDFFQNSIFMHPKNISLIEAEFALSSPIMDTAKAGFNSVPLGSLDSPFPLKQYLPLRSVALQAFDCGGSNNIFIKLLPLILSFTGALSAIILFNLPFVLHNLTNNKIGRNIYAFLNGKYYFDVIYNHFFIITALNLGYNISKDFERGAIELLGPYGLSSYFINAGKNLGKLDTGVITTYSLYITLALISLLFILFFPLKALASYNSPEVSTAQQTHSFEEIRL